MTRQAHSTVVSGYKSRGLGVLLATLLATLSSAPADAAVTFGKAFAWDDNSYSQLGYGNTGTDHDVPVAVRNLTGVVNIDGGYGFTLAATQ